jgi:hypothetical protein
MANETTLELVRRAIMNAGMSLNGSPSTSDLTIEEVNETNGDICLLITDSGDTNTFEIRFSSNQVLKGFSFL